MPEEKVIENKIGRFIIRDSLDSEQYIKSMNFDKDIYKDLEDEGMSVPMELQRIFDEMKGEQSPYYGLTDIDVALLKKNMELKGETPPDTALEISLKKAGIITGGSFSTKFEKLFQGGETIRFLVPALLTQFFISGMIATSLTEKFVAMSSVLDEDRIKKLMLESTEEETRLVEIEEMVDIPEAIIKIGEYDVPMFKFGKYLKVSWGTMKNYTINAVNLFIRQLGQQVGVDKTNRCFYIFINGDGNSGTTPAGTYEFLTSGTITPEDAINFSLSLPDGYDMRAMVAPKLLLSEYWASIMAALQNPQSQFGYAGLSLPAAYHWDNTNSPIPSDNFLGSAITNGLALFTTGAVKTKSEQIIRKMFDGIAFYYNEGWAVIDPNAHRIGDETH